MQFKHLVKTSVCALVLLSAVSVQAADDVYVDLSVLNNLQPGDSLFVETQPLFPVVKKAPVKKAVKKKAKKKTVKKVAPVKVDVEETATGQSIVTAPQAPEIPQMLAEEKKDEETSPKPITLPEPVTETREEIAPVAEPLSDFIQETPIAVPSEAEKPTEEAAQPETKAELSQTETAPVIQQETAEAEPAPVILKPEPAAEPEVIQPLIPAVVETENLIPSEGKIMFDDGDYTVSPQNAEKILALINGFEDPHKHKIAIYAYNYDNGENSFKKKKLSLDRATEIRSLLLNKGYKNFSIKVINVTDDAEKRNLVEIEEIK